ncbi:gamma-aminobutyric acid receptor subunit alpha-2-like [Macrosteles quadrilineatus]|uniref:gamma-aminobutyric acid receptor subunit alpha-2-like n=1 Tax=Macrosteles quadrilineatus TaxID=74068 RepID=UPI0023E12D0F|nr:gamma-aminobutyric acid receptor subunit alpha-2-like [Macrosteles quadrilineatus]XP_054289921.1 gamma-aminobutyric acid receptor subunit alpha-2-like [Macrosteles quadrilineatus]
MGGPPIVVSVNMHIKSFGPISETAQSYTMDVYFRQTWYDSRLQYSLPGLHEFSMSWLFLDKVWKPDTYFMNGKTSHLHRITSPNKFLRLRQDGYIVYSMRLTISARCKMHLRKFPMDTQRCPLLIGSYGYSSNEVMYEWLDLTVEPGLELSQYDLANITVVPHSKFIRNVGEFSMIKANFLLRRSIGYYVLQMYVPCCLIVCCSFVSFWINPDDVPGRVTLAATTVLSITTLGFVGRAALPKVNYATALDWFVILCFATVFAVLVEYAVINFIDKVRVDIQRLLEDRKKLKELKEALKEESGAEESEGEILDKDLEEETKLPEIAVPKILMTYEMEDSDVGDAGGSSDEDLDSLKVEHLAVPIQEAKLKVTRSFSVPTITKGEYRFDQPRLVQDTHIDILLDQNQSPQAARITLRSTLLIPVNLWRNLRILPTEEEVAATTEPPDKFSKIDIYSRMLFPLMYTLLLSGYVVVYTYYVVDDKERYLHDTYK